MNTVQSLNWFDIVLAIIMIASAVAGLRAGFTRVVIGLVATVVGLLSAFWSYRLVGAYLHPWISNVGTANLLGFFVVFFGVIIFGALVAAVLSRILKWVGLSWFNYFLGGVAGFVRGALVVAVLADVLVAFAPSPVPAYLSQSRVLPYANQVAAVLSQMAPQQLKDSFMQQMENLKQYRAEHEHRQS